MDGQGRRSSILTASIRLNRKRIKTLQSLLIGYLMQCPVLHSPQSASPSSWPTTKLMESSQIYGRLLSKDSEAIQLGSWDTSQMWNLHLTGFRMLFVLLV